MFTDKFHKEIEYLRTFMAQNRKEQLVRVYDKNKQEITYHTVGVNYNDKKGICNLIFNEDGEIVFQSSDVVWLSSALQELRMYLEAQNRQIIVRGADRNVIVHVHNAIKLFPTFQLQENNFESYYVLDDSRLEFVTTIADQNRYVELWYAGQTANYFRPNMKTIWKFELKMEAQQTLIMPVESKILSVGVIKNVGYLWAEVSGDIAHTQAIQLLTVPTGAEFPQTAEFIGTLFYKDGEVVQHIFRV